MKKMFLALALIATSSNAFAYQSAEATLLADLEKIGFTEISDFKLKDRTDIGSIALSAASRLTTGPSLSRFYDLSFTDQRTQIKYKCEVVTDVNTETWKMEYVGISSRVPCQANFPLPVGR